MGHNYEHLIPAQRLEKACLLRKTAAEYRRNAETMRRRKWWQWLLFVHIDPRLSVVFLLEADKYEARAVAIEATLK
jgi:hypothetical protein